MIDYFRGPYGINLLWRWHGSALAKAFIPGLLSAIIYLLLHYTLHYTNDDLTDEYVNHPYAIGVLVSSVSFLIIFRANYGYQRYWEACSAVHHFMSKTMDASMHSSVFHLQSKKYEGIRPPSYFDYEELNGRGLTRDRERMTHSVAEYKDPNEMPKNPLSPRNLLHKTGSQDSMNRGSYRLEEGTAGEGEDSRQHSSTSHISHASHGSQNESLQREGSVATLRRRRYEKSINETEHTTLGTQNAQGTQCSHGTHNTPHGPASCKENAHLDETHLLGPGRLDGGWGLLYPNQINGTHTATFYDIQKYGANASRIPPSEAKDADDSRGFASTKGGRTPSLFLQELAHLSSLLMAVALTTLRNDLDDVESPLDVYIPGQPWPEADPINLPKDVKRRAYTHGRFLRNLGYLLGIDQTKYSRTIYNAARPMLVIGGVSDNEIAFLQRARGPYAKTQLAWSWLSDLIIREHLAGSMGNVGPPIVSRMIQFLSDGMIYYNHARKIMFTPFPFPHAQLSAFFVLVMVVAIPFLMDQYANEVWLGACLSFLTVTCLSGLHEVARELENPFRNAPNDVPLCTLLAFYNEALVCMYAGWHPDSYFDGAEVVQKWKREKEEEEERKKSGKNGKSSNGGDDGTGGKGDGGKDVPPDSSDATTASVLIKGMGVHEAIPIDTTKTTPSTAVPQSIEGADALKSLREMIESQSSMIKDLQKRVQLKEERLKNGTDESVGSVAVS